MKPIEKAHAGITARVWQGIAQSGVDTSAIPREELESLVGAITDSVLVGIDEMLGEMRPARPAAQAASDDEAEEEQTGEGAVERTLWEGRPFLSLVEHYELTTERIRITSGLLSKERNDIELFRVQDINHTQHLTERMVNIGDITLILTDNEEENVVLRNVSDPDAVHELIRSAVMDARGRNKVRFHEEM